MTSPAHTRTLITTTTTTKIGSTKTSTTSNTFAATRTGTTFVTTTGTTTAIIITHTIKEATITTDWISQVAAAARRHPVELGIIFTCVVLLLLITMMVTGYRFIHKATVIKNH